MELNWKPKEEIPTEHWEHNYSVSPEYFVKCGYIDGKVVVGYTRYSYATKRWMQCYRATEPGIWEVEYWTDSIL